MVVGLDQDCVVEDTGTYKTRNMNLTEKEWNEDCLRVTRKFWNEPVVEESMYN